MGKKKNPIYNFVDNILAWNLWWQTSGNFCGSTIIATVTGSRHISNEAHQ